ncbi:MAG: acyltransferase family protein [Oscillospiraceae bacterium]
MNKKQQRIESIQIIRAIAFIMIFFSHVGLIATGPIGVSLFLVLSGFCMTYSYMDKPEKTPEPGIVNNFRFAWNKIKKLYPLHVFLLLFVAFIVFSGLFLNKASGKEIAEQVAYFVANGSLLQSWIPWREGYFSFNAVSWYLSTSAFSYFIFPWVFKTIQSKKKRRIGTLACATIVLMILIAVILDIGKQYWGWTSAFQKWVTYIFPLYRAGDFIIGLVAGYVFVTENNKKSELFCSVSEIAVIIMMAVQVILYNSGILHNTNWMLTLFWLPTSVVCVYLFAVNKGVVSKFLTESKVLIWIGNISAEAFLIHQICIKAAEYMTENKWIIAVIAFSATFIAALIWQVFNRKISEIIMKYKT